MTILVTGFSSFPGVPVNPCETVLKWVNQLCDTSIVRTKLLPVSYRRSVLEVDAAILDLEPTFLLHFGVSRRANGLRLEKAAYNARKAQIPDVDQQWYSGVSIVSECQYEYGVETRVPIQKLIERMQAAMRTTDTEISIALSMDPGRYVCNNLYWNTLYKHSEIPGIFVHIPMLDRTNITCLRTGIVTLIECVAGLNHLE